MKKRMHEVAIYLKKNCTFNTVEMATTSKCQWNNYDYVWYGVNRLNVSWYLYQWTREHVVINLL
jgi:hypothetical protein